MFSAGIATAVKNYKTSGSEMASAISALGATATNNNVPLEEQLAILGQLQTTMSGSEAATKYKSFLNQATKAGEALGLQLTDDNNRLLSTPEILEKLKGKYGETIDAVEKKELKDAFGTDEAVAMIDLLYNNVDSLTRQTTKFRVTYPKPRDIVSICFRDRVYQRSLNDNAIYPAMTKSFIQHNCACQKDKGTDYARAVLDEFLHRHYRKYGRAGGVLQVDVHGYYPNMKHQVAKDKFKKHLEPDIYKRAEAVLEDQYEGDVGYNPRSQMIQIAGISVLDELDHFIKEQLGIKRYLRYMDDFLLMHEDLEYLEYCKDKVIEKLAEYGFEPNPKKTKAIPITEEILFLGFYYRLTETGKIIMRLNPANVKQERKKLYRLVAKAKKGESSKAKVDECFNGWKDHAAKGTSYQLLRRMEAYYKELWRNQDGISTDQNKRL